jgi:hypothetical protein
LEREKVMNERPVVQRDHASREAIGDATLTGTCRDSAYVLTDRPDCAVCLMVDQYAADGGRHALMRMSNDEARTLGQRLLDAALSQSEDDPPIPGVDGDYAALQSEDGSKEGRVRKRVIDEIRSLTPHEIECDCPAKGIAALDQHAAECPRGAVGLMLDAIATHE